MSSRIHGPNHANKDICMFRSLWSAFMERLGSCFGFMCKVNNQSDKHNESCECHQCISDSHRTCNCCGDSCNADEWIKSYTERNRNYFDQLDRQRHHQYIGKQFPTYRVPEHGNFECPVNGKACGAEWCKGGCCKESATRAKAGAYWSYD